MFDESQLEEANWVSLSDVGSSANFNLSGVPCTGLEIKDKRFSKISDLELIKVPLESARKNSSQPAAIKFSNCSFSAMSLEHISFELEFVDCEFKGDVLLAFDRALKLSNCSFKSTVKFKGLNINYSQLELNDVVFNNVVRFENFILEDSVDVNRKRINSAFRNVTFHKELTLNNVFFPMDIIFEGISLPKKIVSDRSTFKRLKGVMEHQHNFIDAAFFHSLELNEYRKELKKKKWTEAFEDKVVFGLNWYASKFSLSWLFPFLWIVFLSVVFYVIACPPKLSLEGFLIWFEQFDKDMFFQFMNPFSWNSKAFESVYTVWFLHKLFVVPLVYLLIVAIKRKTKL